MSTKLARCAGVLMLVCVCECVCECMCVCLFTCKKGKRRSCSFLQFSTQQISSCSSFVTLQGWQNGMGGGAWMFVGCASSVTLTTKLFYLCAYFSHTPTSMHIQILATLPRQNVISVLLLSKEFPLQMHTEVVYART